MQPTPYDLLFADQELDEVLLSVEFPTRGRLDVARSRMWEGNTTEALNIAAGAPEPWASFIRALARSQAGESAERTLRDIGENPAYESRQRLWAWHSLRKGGATPSAAVAGELLGCVVEVPVDDGLDVLSAYSDGSARYLNHGGSMTIWEPSNSPLGEITTFLGRAYPLLKVEPAPRDQEAPAPPPDIVRMTALSAMGLHRVEVPWKDVEKGGPYESLFTAAIELLQKLTG